MKEGTPVADSNPLPHTCAFLLLFSLRCPLLNFFYIQTDSINLYILTSSHMAMATHP